MPPRKPSPSPSPSPSTAPSPAERAAGGTPSSSSSSSSSKSSPPPHKPVSTSSPSINSPARRKYHTWTGDAASRNAQSSQDVLLAWLAVPRNCERWVAARSSRASRLKLCREVTSQLRAVGIRHRTDGDVYTRLGAVERGFLAAKRWLEETAMLPAYLSGRAGKDVDAHVRQLCTKYKDLAPAFAASSNAAAATRVVDIDDDEEAGEEDEEDEEDGGDRNEEEKEEEQRDNRVSAEGDDDDDDDEDDDDDDDDDDNTFEPTEANDEAESAAPDSQKSTPTASKLAGGSVASSNGRFEAISSSQESTVLGSETSGAAKTSSKPTPADSAAREKTLSDEETKESEAEATPSAADAPSSQERPRQPLSEGSSPSDTLSPMKSATPSKARATTAAKTRPTAAAKGAPSKRTNAATSVPAPPATDKRSAEKLSLAPKRKTSSALREAMAAASTNLEQPASERKKQKTTPQHSPPPQVKQPQEAVVEQQQQQQQVTPMVTKKPPQKSTADAVAEKCTPHPEELAAILRAVEEERDQRSRLFELQCDKIMQELEAKKIQVVVETAVARKKLLDLGVELGEVDRILPL
ncbi:hypothetical protein PybrP1_012944 [[Pythium] brassicae (nom. inval.)]|nr:hypothetical protein PybrP1_012944 [[Pythium] brassicae (nom. inval.)]